MIDPVHLGVLMVAIWIAVIGGTPASIAIRTSRSRCPPPRMLVAVTSSVQKPTRPGLAPSRVTTWMFSSMKVGDGRLADHHVHAGTHLPQDLVGAVALVVEADAGGGEHADGGLVGHRCAAEDRQPVPGSHLDHLEHLRVAVGDELRDRLPDPVAVVPLWAISCTSGPSRKPTFDSGMV